MFSDNSRMIESSREKLIKLKLDLNYSRGYAVSVGSICAEFLCKVGIVLIQSFL